jgi:hypothetical protein
MTVNNELEGSGRGIFKVLSWHFPGGADENKESRQSG